MPYPVFNRNIIAKLFLFVIIIYSTCFSLSFGYKSKAVKDTLVFTPKPYSLKVNDFGVQCFVLDAAFNNYRNDKIKLSSQQPNPIFELGLFYKYLLTGISISFDNINVSQNTPILGRIDTLFNNFSLDYYKFNFYLAIKSPEILNFSIEPLIGIGRLKYSYYDNVNDRTQYIKSITSLYYSIFLNYCIYRDYIGDIYLRLGTSTWYSALSNIIQGSSDYPFRFIVGLNFKLRWNYKIYQK